MSKSKVRQGSKNMPKKHICARASYLYQAATYLAQQTQVGSSTPQRHVSNPEEMQHLGTDVLGIAQQTTLGSESMKEKTTNVVPSSLGSQRHLVSHLRAVSLKSQFRLPHDVKRSTCRRCNALLIPGSTSSVVLENKSKGSRKPWADIHVITCLSCRTEKRFPVGATKQASKKNRVRDLEVAGSSQYLKLSELHSTIPCPTVGEDGQVPALAN